jgi:ABC-type glutathione transport system ATPase component
MGIGNDVKIEGVIKGVEKMKNKEIQINIDLRDKNLQQHLNKPSKDPIYNKFLELEKKELRDKILSDKAYKDIILNGNLKFDLNDIGITDIDNINLQNLKENILKNEETERVMEYKILDEIKNIKRDNEQHKIKYLTILLIGKKGIGKTTLINYIFGVNEDVNQEIIIIKNENFISYTKKNFPLKILDMIKVIT